MRTTIRRDHIADLVAWDRRPCTVYFNFIVVANHATLGRPTVDQTAAWALAIISFECRVEVMMPSIVAYPVVSFLRRRTYTKKHGDRTAKQRDDLAPPQAGHRASSRLGAAGRSTARSTCRRGARRSLGQT